MDGQPCSGLPGKLATRKFWQTSSATCPRSNALAAASTKRNPTPSKDTWEKRRHTQMRWLMRWTCLLAQRILSLATSWQVSTTDQRYPESMDDGL